MARGELQEEIGFDAETIVEIGHLFQAYGYSNQAFRLYLATGLNPQTKKRDREELDLVSARFEVGAVAEMINTGVIKDVTTVAAFGLLKGKGFLKPAELKANSVLVAGQFDVAAGRAGKRAGPGYCRDEKMELAGFILLMLGALLLLAFSLSADLAAFVSGNNTLIIGASMVVAGLVLLYLCDVKQKNAR